MNNAKITGTVTKEITVRGDVKHTYISSGGGEGEFKPFDVVNSIAKSFYRAEPERIVSYVYAPKRESDGDKFTVFRKNSSDVVNLGVRPVAFSENFSTVSCGIVFGANNSFETIYSGNDWIVSNQISYASCYFSEPLERNLYNLRSFDSYHPVFNDTDFVKIGEEVTINLVNNFRFGDVFNTGISNGNNVVIVTFASGIWIYKYDSGVIPTATYDNGIYKFDDSSGIARFNLTELIDTNQNTKKTLDYISSAGNYSVDLASEELNVTTCDICDTNGNVLFAKNANIEDYI